MASIPEPQFAKVFLSYSHDSDPHKRRVREIADRLRSDHGIEAWLDQYDEIPPPRSWPQWMYRQVSEARFVLVVCTATYRRRFEAREVGDRGLGARWEGAIITQELYHQQSSETVKFVPVLLENEDPSAIPELLSGTTHYTLDRDWNRLVRHLQNRPLVVAPPLKDIPTEADGVPHDLNREASSASEPKAVRTHETDELLGTLDIDASIGREESAFPESPRLVSLPEGAEVLKRWFSSDTTANQQISHALDSIAQHPARSVIIEPGYPDPGYRREYAAYYAQLFAPHSPLATRVHFFSDRHDEMLRVAETAQGYLGSAVMRPIESARLGATHLLPPPALSRNVLTSVTAGVELFGISLGCRGAPFTQVDAQIGMASATAAAWMCHSVAHARGLVRFASVADLDAQVSGVEPALRGSYRTGITLEEMRNALARVGLTSVVYDVQDPPIPFGVEAVPVAQAPARRARALLLRYLHSGLPIIALDANRAVVVIGHIPGDGDDDGGSWIVHDSGGGPYLVIESDRVLAISDTAEDRWSAVCVPLPIGVRLSAEGAELRGALYLRVLHEKLGTGTGVIRTRLARGTKYKRVVSNRGLRDEAVQKLRVAPLPEWIWVVQLVDQDSSLVRAEVLFDAASSDLNPTIAAALVSGVGMVLQGSRPIHVALDGSRWRMLSVLEDDLI
jgi:SEFIR domain